MIIDALKNKYSLPDLLKRLELLKNSYYCQEASMKKPDKYNDIRVRICLLFNENKQRYGYRRIYGLLKRESSQFQKKWSNRLCAKKNLLLFVSSTENVIPI